MLGVQRARGDNALDIIIAIVTAIAVKRADGSLI